MTDTTVRPATEKQAGFIRTLLGTRVGYSEGFADRVEYGLASGAMTIDEAKRVINWLLELEAREVTVTPGVFVMNGEFWLLRKARKGTHCYAMRLASPPMPGAKLNWTFAPGMTMKVAAAGRPVTAAEAAALGHQTHHCCFCGLELTDDGDGKSVDVGYGPVCAKNNGLPWG